MGDKYYSKADLIEELANAAEITKKSTEEVLARLAKIAYREARNSKGFILPGICKMDVVRRKGRYGTIPSTGRRYYLSERDALRIRALKKAKHAVAPTLPDMLKYVDEDHDLQKGDTPQEPTASQQFNPEGLVSFKCGTCGQEIEAPFDMAGNSADCPACSGHIEVPYVSEPGTLWGRANPDQTPPLEQTGAGGAAPALEPPVPAAPSEAALGRTIRIELPDDI